MSLYNKVIMIADYFFIYSKSYWRVGKNVASVAVENMSGTRLFTFSSDELTENMAE